MGKKSFVLVFMFVLFLMTGALVAAQETSVTQFASPVNYTINTANGARGRSCPNTSCATVTTFRNRLVVSVFGTAVGARVSGSTTWLAIRWNGQVVFVHSSLARQGGTTASPVSGSGSTGASAGASSGSAGNVSTGSGSPAPVSTPVAGPPPFACNCARTCSAMTCDEAYYQLNTCGCSQRDGDGDGVPCESICPGG
jgi:hypothetical protein